MFGSNQMKSCFVLGLIAFLAACSPVVEVQGQGEIPVAERQAVPGALTAADLGRTSVSGRPAKTFVVREYRFEQIDETGNPEIGLALCGPRCNGLSGSVANILKPGGWRLVKIAENVEVKVDLDNPFMKGQCLCVGDEYNIDWFDPTKGGCEMGNSE